MSRILLLADIYKFCGYLSIFACIRRLFLRWQCPRLRESPWWTKAPLDGNAYIERHELVAFWDTNSIDNVRWPLFRTADCSAIILEKDIYIAVLAALQQRCAFADKARKDFDAKLVKLAPSIESLATDIAKCERLIEKTETSKMSLWEKFQTGQIFAEGFQAEIEKTDKQIEHYSIKISHTKDKISKLEMESGQENIFVERFSRHAGLKELT